MNPFYLSLSLSGGNFHQTFSPRWRYFLDIPLQSPLTSPSRDSSVCLRRGECRVRLPPALDLFRPGNCCSLRERAPIFTQTSQGLGKKVAWHLMTEHLLTLVGLKSCYTHAQDEIMLLFLLKCRGKIVKYCQ